MNKIFIGFTLLIVSCSAFAIDGHNGILFEMTQAQIESKGFICNPTTIGEKVVTRCKHMDMTGVAFSVPTNNYEVQIGADGHVDSIQSDLLGIRSTADYLALLGNISGFFPAKDESRNLHSQGVMMDWWRANNGAAISVFYSSGVRGILKDTLHVTFHSPKSMAIADKALAENQKKRASQASQ